MVQIFLLYKANVFFNFIAAIVFLIACILVGRYSYIVFVEESPASSGFWPTIIFSAGLLTLSVQLFLTGMLASLISSLRRLAEDINFRLKQFDQPKKDRQSYQ